MKRCLGTFVGKERGPLIICFGAMHGNEPAGVNAIEAVLKLLDVEHIKNPGFSFKGKMVGLIGNLKAYNQGKRFINKDLNRQFLEPYIKELMKKEINSLEGEEQELIQLIDHIKQEIKIYNPEQLIILDLHTTSSMGGIFSICQSNDRDVSLAKSLHAPVVLGMLEGLQGTTLHYFTHKNTGVDTVCLTFESGQHDEVLSINRAVAGILCCMRQIGSVQECDVENHHEERLIAHTKNLPKITTLIDRYHIENNDTFKMLPGFKNFQEIRKGQTLAKSGEHDIKAKENGRILMPLYQKQGEDGFFVVKEII